MLRVALLCSVIAVIFQLHATAYPRNTYLPQQGGANEWVSLNQGEVTRAQELEGWQKEKLAEFDELLGGKRGKSVYSERDAYGESGLIHTDVLRKPFSPSYIYTSPVRSSVLSPFGQSSFFPFRQADTGLSRNRLEQIAEDNLFRNLRSPVSLVDGNVRDYPLRSAVDVLTGSTPIRSVEEVLSRNTPLSILDSSSPLRRLEDINVFRSKLPSETENLLRGTPFRPLEESVFTSRSPISSVGDNLLRNTALRLPVSSLLGDRFSENTDLLSSVAPLFRGDDIQRTQRLAENVLFKNDPLRLSPLLRAEDALLRRSPFRLAEDNLLRSAPLRQNGLLQTSPLSRVEDSLLSSTPLRRDGGYGILRDVLSPLGSTSRLWGENIRRSAEDLALADTRLRLADAGLVRGRDRFLGGVEEARFSDALLRASDERISSAFRSPNVRYTDLLSPSFGRSTSQRWYGFPSVGSLATAPDRLSQSAFVDQLVKDSFGGISPLTSWNDKKDWLSYGTPLRA